MIKTNYDLLIIGGGPAGSTAAAFARQRGLSVGLVEKDSFPRFHIGESLLPMGNQVLRAVYTHFRGVPRPEGKRAGHIIVVRLEGGWFWIIPIDAERTSVGLVTTLANLRALNGEPEEFFRRTDNDSFAVFLTQTPPLDLGRGINSIVAGHANMTWPLWWRFKIFLLVCRLQQRFRIMAKPIDYAAAQKPA